MNELRYAIFDPTGNITALVESQVEISRQPSVAAALMQRHPEVEQVGFFSCRAPERAAFCESDPEAAQAEAGAVQAELRMAGGEFCGNATMSAAALYYIRHGSAGADTSLQLRVSGAPQPVAVELKPESAGSFSVMVRMPEAREIFEKVFSWKERSGKLPVVRMSGISHVILEPASEFFPLKMYRSEAEAAVKEWCAQLKTEGLGLMFLEEAARAAQPEMTKPGSSAQKNVCRTEKCLTPLVYIPGCQTVFWENSCASGSSAAGMYLAHKTGRSQELLLHEPGGTLAVHRDLHRQETWLYGKTRLVATESGISMPGKS